MAIAQNSIEDKLEMNETLNGSLDDVPVDVNRDDPLVSNLEPDSMEVETQSTRSSAVSGILENLPFLITGIVLLIIVLVVFQTLEMQRAASQAEYVERSSGLLALSQQIAVDASTAIAGNRGAFDGLREATQELTSIVESLEQGDPGTQLAPLPQSSRELLAPVLSLWSEVKPNVETTLSYQGAVLNTHDQVIIINKLAPLLLTRADELVDAVVEETKDVALINEIARLRGLSQRIAKDVNIYALGKADAPSAAGQIGRDITQFQTSLDELHSIGGPVTLARLEEVDVTFC